MPEPLGIALATGTGYLLGSLSFAQLLGRLRGVDLRRVGSGNLGATNAGRVLGRGIGALVFLLDAGKAALAAGLGLTLFRSEPQWEPGAAGAAGALAGHVWPLFFGFRGGKGVATVIGGMLVLAPLAALAALALLALAVLLTRYMSLGSLAFAAALPAAVAWLYHERGAVFWLALAAAPLLWYTHRANLARLLRGEELRLGRGKTT